ncbi:MAG TPA: rod shape-determining protein MreC [Terriglobales bacterium]|nr:rod shape-determining protein MreC [Terriglobales bacterium]
MDSFFSRYRNLTILVAVLFAQVLGLAVQVRRKDEKSDRLLRIWAVAAISPLEKGVIGAQHLFGDIWHNYFWLRGVRTENAELRDEIQRLRLEQIRLTQDAAQARRLQTLLAFKEQFIHKTVAAQVIGTSGSEASRLITIDKGRDSGVATDQAVITSEGVVGKVVKVYGGYSQVLLLSDPASGVGALMSNSRLQGVVRGTPNGELMLHYIMADEKVEPGELILTSGGDRVFPKGLPIGVVSDVARGPDLFLNIRVKPAARLGRLEEVLVITQVDERSAQPETAGPVRAADILAERLPTLPPPRPDGTTPNAAKLAAPGATGASPNKPAAPATTPNAAPAAVNPAATNPGTKPGPKQQTGEIAKPPQAVAQRSGDPPDAR